MTTTKKSSRSPMRDPKTGRIAPFVPTAELRQIVLRMASINCTNQEILFVAPWGRPDDKPIDEKTLRKHFSRELAKGEAMRGVKIKQGLFDAAANGNIAALIFLAKSRLGWSETVKVEATGKDGAPLPGPTLYLPAKEQLPEEALSTFERRSPAQPERAAEPSQLPPPSPPDSHTSIDVGDAREPAKTAFGSIRPTTFYPAAADPLRRVLPS